MPNRKFLLTTIASSQRGIVHYFLPLLIILFFAIGGTYLFVFTQADSVKSHTKCKKRTVLLEAVPDDFVSGSYNAPAVRGHGLFCYPSSLKGVRQQVTGPTQYTIVKSYKCASNEVLAYNSRSPGRTAYHKKWLVQTKVYSDDYLDPALSGHIAWSDRTTLYCIPARTLYKVVDHYGLPVIDSKGDPTFNDIGGDRQFYYFRPFFSLTSQCGPSVIGSFRWANSDCQPSYFLSYYRSGDVLHK